MWAGLASYTASIVAAWQVNWRRVGREHLVLGCLMAGVALFAFAIEARWARVGHGPFLTLFEILLSNLFSLGLVYAVIYWRFPAVRVGAPAALAVLLMLGGWSLIVSVEPSRLPATYENPWLWIHVGVGKLYLGTCLAATGLAVTALFRRTPAQVGGVDAVAARISTDETLDAAAWRLMAAAFLFDSLLLIAGAVWAQDAWGRYWAWDPLETWSFVTWLALAISLHARATCRIPLWGGWLMIVGVFVLAFLTFFGVPFVSEAAHKGVM